MNSNARYTNKAWARKVMTILLDNMVLFEVVDRTARDYNSFRGVYELGIKFYASSQGTVTLWPTCENDLNEARCLCY